MERKLKEERKVGGVQAEGKEPHVLLHHPAPAVTCTHNPPAKWGLAIPVITHRDRMRKFPNTFVPSSERQWAAHGEILNPCPLSNFTLENTLPAMLKQRLSNLSAAQKEDAFFLLLPQGDLFSLWFVWLRAGSGNQQPKVQRWASCSTAASHTGMWQLPTVDNISNYFQSTPGCQTKPEKAASVFLNSDGRPEHQDLEGNNPPSQPKPPRVGSRAQPRQSWRKWNKAILHPVFSSNLILSNLTPCTF